MEDDDLKERVRRNRKVRCGPCLIHAVLIKLADVLQCSFRCRTQWLNVGDIKIDECRYFGR